VGGFSGDVQVGFAQETKPGKAALYALQEAFVAVAEEVEPAVVTITAQRTVRPQTESSAPEEEGIPFPFGRGRRSDPFRAEGTGSGVIISADGWVLTNDHVVSGADKVLVKLNDGREFYGKVTRDYRSDLALVKLEGNNFPVARLGDSDKVKIGQWAIAIGSPYRYEGSFSVGVISSLYRRQEIRDRSSAGGGRLYPNMIQTDAAINPGNSGGPLVNIEGEVIGINTAIESETGGSVGIGFAIPINTARFVIEQLKTKGRVSYGYLGIEPETVTPRLASSYRVPSGALVRAEPQPDTPAGKAGIQVDDVVTQIDGRPIRNELDLRTTVSRIPPGTTVSLTLVRNGNEKRVLVTIGEAPDIQPRSRPTAEASAPAPRLGLDVSALTPDAAKKAGLSETAEGVVVKSIDRGSGASESELESGDIILRVNGTPTPSVEAFRKVTATLKSGDVVRLVWQGRRGRETLRRVAIVSVD